MPSLFSVDVRVPGTSANLGPGFDVLGLALAIHESVRVTFGGDGPAVRVRAAGPGSASIPVDSTNLVVRALRALYRKAGKSLPAVDIQLDVRLPVAGGLGSSSAAIVGGLVAANESLGRPLDLSALIDLATDMEGHPDNVAPALTGGLTMAVRAKDAVRWVAWKEASLFKNLRAVVVVPSFQVPTAKARRALPARVPRADAVFNAAHVALLLGAVRSGRWALLGEAMDDRLHQPYREKLVPGLSAVIGAARRAGAHGAALSGAGPSVLALCAPAAAPRVARAMVAAFGRKGSRARSEILKIDTAGARVFGVSRKRTK